MVEYRKEAQLDLVFHALADSTRRDLLARLKDQDQCVTDLASKYDVSLNAVSKHLKVLEKAKLIERTVRGRSHFCRTRPDELKKVERWIAPYKKFWEQSLDNLDKYLNTKKGE